MTSNIIFPACLSNFPVRRRKTKTRSVKKHTVNVTFKQIQTGTKPKLGTLYNLSDYKHKSQKQKNSKSLFSDKFSTSSHYSGHYFDGSAPLATPVTPASGNTAFFPEKAKVPPSNQSSRPLVATFHLWMLPQSSINSHARSCRRTQKSRQPPARIDPTTAKQAMQDYHETTP